MVRWNGELNIIGPGKIYKKKLNIMKMPIQNQNNLVEKKKKL